MDIYTLFFNHIKSLIGAAFYYMYLPSDDNQFSIESITVFWEKGDKLPIVQVDVNYQTKFDGNFILGFDVDLNKSDDWNIGRIVSRMEQHYDSQV